MRRLFLLLVVLMPAFSTLPGCGSGASSTPAEQEKKYEQTKADMAKGMEAMKAMKGPKK